MLLINKNRKDNMKNNCCCFDNLIRGYNLGTICNLGVREYQKVENPCSITSSVSKLIQVQLVSSITILRLIVASPKFDSDFRALSSYFKLV
jgi:hypothetical protein